MKRISAVFACVLIASLSLGSLLTPADGAMTVAAKYPLDEVQGTVIDDVSANNQEGTYDNGPLLNRPGVFGKAVELRWDDDDYGVLPRTIGDDFSIEFWMKSDADAGGPHWYNGLGIVDGEVPNLANDFGIAIVYEGVGFGVGNPDVTILSETEVDDNEWHHVVATRHMESGEIKLYVDSVLEDSAIAGNTGSLDAPENLLLGRVNDADDSDYEGRLDNLILYSSVLTAAEVRTQHRLGDKDNDGSVNREDNCPTIKNPNQSDKDDDGKGDLCESSPHARKIVLTEVKNGKGAVSPKTDGFTPCIRSVPVIIQRKEVTMKQGKRVVKWDQVKSGKTDDTGKYNLPGDLGDGTYRATALKDTIKWQGKDHVCSKATSEPKTV